jgi:CheY-like chemotaxis protein
MNFESQLITLKHKNRDLPLSERAAFSCRIAKELEQAGEYNSAREALTEFWPEGEKQELSLGGLEDDLKAEILSRIGSLTGWLGAAAQVDGSQEAAKNLLTQSIDIFRRLNLSEKLAEASGDLALCYWREGSYDEARITLENALKSLEGQNPELQATLLIRAGVVEVDSRRMGAALRLYDKVAKLLEQSTNHALLGSFHNSLGLALRRFADPINLEDYLDRALMEYTAASFHFEQAGNTRYLAGVENNLGFLFCTLKRFAEAHAHLTRAGDLFRELRDEVHAAQVNETRARTFLGENRLPEAERLVRSSVKVLERGDEQALLAEALTTYGTVTARLGRYARARELLDRAIDIAQTAGDLEGAGRAKLSIIEELEDQTSAFELAATFESATELLQKSQDPSATKRLISCAQRVIEALKTDENEALPTTEPDWEEFSLRQQVRNYEKALIERALREAGGAVTKAAHLLGFKHHQSLISLINSRHRDLLGTRSAVRKRRSHIFSKPRKLKRTMPPQKERSTSRISILHVEDHKLVAQLVNDLLSAENWQVEQCADSDTALRKLTGNEHFDVLVVDNDLDGLSGLELVQRARKMTHRRRTPMIMLSGGDYETAAWRVGVDAFLKKPEEITDLPTTINRLLRDGSRST